MRGETRGKTRESWLLLVFLALACRSEATAGADEPASLAAELVHGIALVEQGDLEAGIAALRGVVSADSGDGELAVKARSWIVTALTRAGDPEGALREGELALERAPDDPWLHYACGVALYEMGDLERARAEFTQGIERDPRHIKCLQWRALTLRDLDDDRSAIDDLARALECIESADDAALASWKGNRRSLLLKTLDLRIKAYDDLGLHDEANRDRARYEQVFAGAVPASAVKSANP